MPISKKTLTIYCALILFMIFILLAHVYANKPTVIENPSPSDYKGQALITFSYDDGRINNYEYALPLHVKYNIPATFNIVASRIYDINEREYSFNEDMVKEAHKKGIEIASHGYFHKERLTEQSDEDVEFELLESKKILEKIVGNVDTIAIPFSGYDERVKAITKKYYKGARVHGRLPNEISSIDFHWLRSYEVTNETTFNDIKILIDQAVKDKTWLIIMLHGVEPENDSLYEITPKLLEEILNYVSSYKKEELLPVNTRDGISFIEGTKK